MAVEGVGTLELTAAERDGMHRIDVRELDPALQSLARQPLLSAFRYQRDRRAPTPGLTLDAKRFADAGVLAGGRRRASATTLDHDRRTGADRNRARRCRTGRSRS